MSAVLEVRGLSKHFTKGGEDLVALRDLDLAVEPGGFLVLLGRSGCGKSTLLNLLAGLAAPTNGQITYRGEEVTGPRTQVGYLTPRDRTCPRLTRLLSHRSQRVDHFRTRQRLTPGERL